MRLLAAIGGDWIMRPDELFQYLEQAHRIVFGYGSVPWEFRFAERTWLLPALSVPPLWLAKITGLDSPSFYVSLTDSWHSLLSLAVPAGMYFFTRRFYNETGARIAFVLGCFWHELIVSAPHAQAEFPAAACFFAALAFAAGGAGKNAAARAAACGLFLGLTVLIRPTFVFAAGFAALLFLRDMRPRARAAMVGAGLATVFLVGLWDYAAWGGMWKSYFNYAKWQTSGYAEIPGWASPPGEHLESLLIASGGLFYIVFAAALFRVRRLWIPMAFFLLLFLPHQWSPLKEYTNLFPARAVLLVLAGCLIARWLRTGAKKKPESEGGDDLIPPKTKAAALAAAFALVSLAGLFGKLPGMEKLPPAVKSSALFYRFPFYTANYALSRLPPEEVKSVVFLVAPTYAHFGGHYYTHQNAPLLFPFTNSHDYRILNLPDTGDGTRRNEIFNAVLQNAGAHFAKSASHLIVPRGISAAGFSVAEENAGDYWLLANENIGGVSAPAGAVYDILDNGIMGLVGLVKQLDGIEGEISDYPLTPYR